MSQPTENTGQLFVIVIDETYGGDEATYEADSERYRQELERDFEARFQEVNVGPGADIPAFLTDLANINVPLWSASLATFFLGKSVKENLHAWVDMCRAVRRFFTCPVVLARHGAAVLAIEAVFDQIGGTPKSVRLLRYRAGHTAERIALGQVNLGAEIDDNPPTLNLGYVVHFFEIEADSLLFRVAVDGKRAEIIRIHPGAVPPCMLSSSTGPSSPS